jgi:hypothetical protein
MAGNGGLDGRSTQSLVGCCDDEARIFFFSLFIFHMFRSKNYLVLVMGLISQWSIMTKAVFSFFHLCHTEYIGTIFPVAMQDHDRHVKK